MRVLCGYCAGSVRVVCGSTLTSFSEICPEPSTSARAKSCSFWFSDSLSSRISNLSGAVSEANTVAEGTKKELSMLAEGISNETIFNEAIDLARKGGSVDDIVKQTKLSKDQAETIVRFHGSELK